MALFCNPWRDNSSAYATSKRRGRHALVDWDEPDNTFQSWGDLQHLVGVSALVPEMERASSSSSVSSDASTVSTLSNSSVFSSSVSPVTSKRKIFASYWVGDSCEQRKEVTDEDMVNGSRLASCKSGPVTALVCTEDQARKEKSEEYETSSCLAASDSEDAAKEAMATEKTNSIDEQETLTRKRRTLFPQSSFGSNCVPARDSLPSPDLRSGKKGYGRMQKAKSTSCIDGRTSPRVMKSSLRCSTKWKGKARSKSHPNFSASVSFDPHVQVLEFRRCEVQYAPADWWKMFSYN